MVDLHLVGIKREVCYILISSFSPPDSGCACLLTLCHSRLSGCHLCTDSDLHGDHVTVFNWW